ncbi:MAG: pyruvate kinase, partial [Ignavibacteriales bacterium]|nr:pyruvate kinase [Ignavibacteriales bacterium]
MTKKNSFGRTKIIGTIGPASSSVESLVSLIQAGMDVVRLNFSHGTYTNHQTVIENVKRASAMTGEHITVMQDLSGPKIRTGVLKNGSVVLKEGDLIRFTIEEIEGTKERVSTTYKNLPRDVQPENIILLDDGKLRVRVVETSPTEVACKVEVGGTLSN